MAAPPSDARSPGSNEAQRFAESLRPSMEEAVRLSVQADPRVLAGALHPAIGPAIRHAVSAAWNDMVQALSRILDDAFSPGGLRWRWESFRTGRPLGEIAYSRAVAPKLRRCFSISVFRRVSFEPGSSRLDGASLAEIERLAGWIQAAAPAAVQIDGHAGRTGPEARNRRLSAARAEAVLEALVAKNVPAGRLRPPEPVRATQAVQFPSG